MSHPPETLCRPALGRIIIMMIVISILPGCSLFGIRTSEEPGYRVLLSEGNKELREYPAVILARTVMEGDYDATSNESFRILAGYIFGKNRTNPAGEEPVKIPMTAPVLQERKNDGWEMSFVMPSRYGMTDLPPPADDRVSLAETPAMQVAALRYTGLTSEDKIRTRAEDLEAWVRAKGLKPAGRVFSARYDPPWTIPFLRRNEVLLVVETE